jgi:hypothetical protein
MNRNWWSLLIRILPVLLAVLAVSHPALADTFHHHHHTWFLNPGDLNDAPELDPRLAIEGIAVAGVAAALIWERIRRRR